MSRHVVVTNAIDALESSSDKNRAGCFDSLIHCLRDSASSGELEFLPENLRHRLLEVAINVVATEHKKYVSGSSAKTKQTQAHRLSVSAGAIRVVVEIICRQLRSRGIKLLLDHLLQSFRTPSGDICEPVALDNAKTLATLLSYQAHVEHFTKDTWTRILTFALQTIDASTWTDPGASSPGEIGTTATFRSSLRTSISHPDQGPKRQVIDELIKCIAYLTNVPNAHVAENADDLLQTLLSFLDGPRNLPAAVLDAFAACNNVFSLVLTEKLRLVRSSVSRLLNQIRQHWQSKSTELHGEMLITLIYLQPFVDRQGLQSTVEALCETMKAEYVRRLARDRLSSDDIRLKLGRGEAPVCNPCFGLSTRRSTAEHNWAFLSVLASLQKPPTDIVTETQLSAESELPEHQRKYPNHSSQRLRNDTEVIDNARKRIRLEVADIEILRGVDSEISGEKLLAVQLIAFSCQQALSSEVIHREFATSLLITCNEDDLEVSNWAFIALTSLATVVSATEESMRDTWLAAWNLATRAITNAGTCRAACHLLDVISQLRLVEQTTVTEFVRTLTASMDLNGPTTISDAALHLCTTAIRISKEETPSSSSELALQLLGWLFRQWIPSRSAARAADVIERNYNASDVLRLLFVLLDHDYKPCDPVPAQSIGRIGISLFNMKKTRPLLDYLLLASSPDLKAHHIFASDDASAMLTSQSRARGSSVETLLLTTFSQELIKLLASMKEQEEHARSMSAETYTRIAIVCLVSITIAYDILFADLKHTREFRRLSNSLLEEVVKQASDSESARKLDILMSVTASDTTESQLLHSQSRTALADAVGLAFYKRARLPWLSGFSDAHGSADIFSSQSQGDDTHEGSVSHTSSSMLAVEVSVRAAQNVTALSAQLVLEPEETTAQSQSSSNKALLLTEHIVALADIDMLLSLRALAQGLIENVQFSDQDLERLLELCTTRFFSLYNFNRSEFALSIVIDFMSCTVRGWTESASESLNHLGMDMYEWLTSVALTGNVLSSDTKERLASLLIKICKFNPDYGSQSTDRSARTSLLQMLQDGPVRLQYYLAPKLPAMFNLFTLSLHGQLFYDIQKSLPVDTDWAEGIAMRLQVLTEVGSTWPSLLQACVYYIFETARYSESKAHATRCMSQLARALNMEHASTLFCLYSRQMLYTWLDDHSLRTLPYDVFSFATRAEFQQQNLSEITAQLFLRDNQVELASVCKMQSITVQDAIQHAFDRIFAYVLKQDITSASQPQSDQSHEQRLRSALVTKEHFRRLAKTQYAVVIGRLMLDLHIDGEEEKWLEKRDDCQLALAAFKRMTRYSRSTWGSLPVQQPSLKSKYLPDLLDRLTRRISLESSATLWTPASFTIVSQMLIDSLDSRLNPLQNNATTQALRLLITLAGQAAFEGPQLEMTVRSIAPLLNDTVCADDTIGILFYLLSSSEEYLCQHVDFSWATVILLLLRIKVQLTKEQDSVTQESQYLDMIKRLHKFSQWLIDLLRRIRGTVPERCQGLALRHIDYLAVLKLPGNACKDTPESALLLTMLEEGDVRRTLISDHDVYEIIGVLTTGFQAPVSFMEDVLGSDEAAVRYNRSLRQLCQRQHLGIDFLTWILTVIGRAYLATGEADNGTGTANGRKIFSDEPDVDAADNGASIAIVAQTVHNLCSSFDPREISLGVFTYRSCIDQCTDPNTALMFEKPFRAGWADVYNAGTCGYTPAFLQTATQPDRSLGSILVASSSDTSEWATSLVLALCGMPWRTTLIHGLVSMLRVRPDLSLRLLPSIIHITLSDEDVKGREGLRKQLTQTMSDHFVKCDANLAEKQKALLEVLLYLLEQPYQDERTIMDRLQWIPCNFMQAATCAAKVGMPTAALKLAELSRNEDLTQRRSLSRPPALRSIADDLLLSIYRQVDEPDSYYGVTQQPTLSTLLQRADHEDNGYQSLTIRSAQLDAQMIKSHSMPENVSTTFSQSLSRANLESLAYSFAQLGAGDMDTMLDKARSLQQWDMPLPRSITSPSAVLYQASAMLTTASDADSLLAALRTHIRNHAREFSRTATAWLTTLGSLVEMLELAAISASPEVTARWEIMVERENWMPTSSFAQFNTIIGARCSTTSALSSNQNLSKSHSPFTKSMKLLEARSLASLSKLAVEHDRSETALSAAWRLSDLAASNELEISGIAQRQLAAVMWHAGETAMSTQILQELTHTVDATEHDIAFSKAILLSDIGQQLASARSQDSTTISEKYLKPAIDILVDDRGATAGQVYHAYAAFCDDQLQNAAATEEYDRIMKLRQQKLDEVSQLETLVRSLRKGDERDKHERILKKTRMWLKLDDDEYQRHRRSRDSFAQQSLANYMRALYACDDYDTCVLRFYALWLENADTEHTQSVINDNLSKVPTWKFVVLMNQLMSRLTGMDNAFQKSLLGLVARISQDHPYHTVHHLYAFRKTPGKDEVALSRRSAAERLSKEAARDKRRGDLFSRMSKADSMYRQLAEEPNGTRHNGKYPLKDSQNASRLARYIPQENVAPATIDLALEPDGRYLNVPTVTGFRDEFRVMSGLSAPKVLTAYASDGLKYRQLFKSGNDDLRQDAIMEQVFMEVSKMLRKHKSTRQRHLQVRTYKVIPLAPRTGIIEFVPDSIALNEFLSPAHSLYHPGSMKTSAARQKLLSVQSLSVETRVKEFRKVCEQIPPVLRFFFFERFSSPGEWFTKRTAYTRTTAAISMLGHVLGLGDRHCQNILLDEKSGEVVHIDLGVAFEAGRVLPAPELVPFRLTRDIIDGMGATGTEGVFRRCCEFTMDALREDKDDIMTLLNVLRYDPLYTWTLSPIRAKRMQQQEEGQESKVGFTKKQQVDETGEAERALGVVAKKLGSTLSTAATVSELIQQAVDEKNLATLFCGWSAFY